MAATERIIFQPYIQGRRGVLTPGQSVACRNAADAERRAEKAVGSGIVLGAHIVRVIADEDAGDYGEPEFLGAYGRVPEIG